MVEIHHISDTATWVAYYRWVETQRPDALFKDPLSKVLVGDRGRDIAESLKKHSCMTEYQVVMRTYLIDQFIQDQVKAGVDTVINLGAGLDTRPYRLNLPASLRWIELDYPALIDTKNKLLESHTPTVELTRIPIDLADRAARQTLFAKLGKECKNALILTEGVIIYLTEVQVSELAQDLHSIPSFKFWLTEFLSNRVYRYLRSTKRAQLMKNAPFLFFPDHWLKFFEKNGWRPAEKRYIADIGVKTKRRPPIPWFAYLILGFVSKKYVRSVIERSGYFLYEKI